MFKQYKIKNYSFRLIVYVCILCIIGILVIGSADPSSQKRQMIGLVGSLIVMAAISLVDYKHILKFHRILYALGVILLALIYSPMGVTLNNATRWIGTESFTVQPSEFCKILLIIFLAAYFMKCRDHINTLRVILTSLICSMIYVALIIKQPDLSTSVIVTLIFITLLFVAGLSYKIVLGALAVIVPAAAVSLVLMFRGIFPILKTYQYERILAWRYPQDYPGETYQQTNSVMAIGSGQLWGKGLYSESTTSVKNGNFISEGQTDFIFAIIGEELGFVGCVIVIILLVLIVLELLLIARRAKDQGGRLFISGMAALIGFQSFVNICVATGLLPNTGLPLPFVSYGLTSLFSLFIGLGIVLNVALQSERPRGRDRFP